jgi:IS5 family transposase
VATTLKEGLVVGMRSMPGNPWDGHTLANTLEQVAILTDHAPTTALVDRGYRGVTVEGVRVLHSGQKRGVTQGLKAMIKRRSAIEPAIGHMKTEGRLGRNPLKGALGDALHAVLCGAGHNLRLLLRKLRLLWAWIWAACSWGIFGDGVLSHRGEPKRRYSARTTSLLNQITEAPNSHVEFMAGSQLVFQPVGF